MAMRPYCLRCGSGMVERDDDQVQGIVVIRCAACGRRKYQGQGGPIGFAMREEAPAPDSRQSEPPPDDEEGCEMAKRPCKNCGRTKEIIKEGHCYLCAKAAKGLEGEKKDAALAEIKAKIENGEFKTRNTGERTKPAPAAPGARKTKQAAAGEKDPANAQEAIQDAVQAERQAGPPEEFLRIRFAGIDVKLLREFETISGHYRRTVEDQVLYMIQKLVTEDFVGIQRPL